MTPPEAALWAYLRGRSPDRPTFRRQHPIGPYILDFYCSATRLAVEIDGRIHELGDNPEHDRRRTAWLAEQGIEVFRTPASDVLQNAAEVARNILDLARSRQPH